MNLERVLAVLEVVGLLDRLRRQLPRLADRNESSADALRHRGAEDEAAALDADHGVDALPGIRHRQQIDRRLEAGRIAQQRRDVVEEDAGLRKVRNVANVLFEVHAVKVFFVSIVRS